MTAPAKPSRPPLWQAALGVVISVALLWWSLRGVKFEEVASNIRAAHGWPVLLGVLLATIPFPLRIFRWRILLRGDQGEPLSARAMWHAIAMGFMANNLLPFRAGEVVRTYAVSRLTGARFTTALTSIAVERVFDGLTMVLFLTVALFLPGLPEGAGGGGLQQKANLFGILCLGILLASGFVVAWPQAAEAVVRRLLPFPRVAERVVTLIEGIRHGLLALRSPSRLLVVAFWSLVIWGVNVVSFYVFFSAFDIQVNLAGAMLLQSILAFGIAVPSTPGYLGVFEAGAVAALALYEVPRDVAVSFAIAYHFTTFLPITLLGLFSVVRTNLGLKQLRGSAP